MHVFNGSQRFQMLERRLRLRNKKSAEAHRQGSACSGMADSQLADARAAKPCLVPGCYETSATSEGVWPDGRDNPKSRFRCRNCNCWRKKLHDACKLCEDDEVKAFGDFDADAKEVGSKFKSRSKLDSKFVLCSTMWTLFMQLC